jgi:tetratricopeptide (TPR) repeat protein
MPEYPSFVVALKTILPEAAWPWVLAALRQDALVWDSLQEPDFSERALAEMGAQPEAWTPAGLAFLALGQPLSAAGSPLDPLLRQRALRAYESLIRQNQPGSEERPTLAGAGLLALTLAEHRHVSGSWGNLPTDLSPVPTHNPAFGRTWRTPLAILYGLAADRLNLLAELIYPGAPLPFIENALHALLSNPLPPTEQGQVLATLLRELPLPEAGVVLRQIEKHRPELSSRLARRLLGRQATLPAPRRSASNLEKLDLVGQLLFNAEIHSLASQPSQAASLRSLALNQTRALQLEIAAQLAETAANAGDLPAAGRAWASISPTSDGAEPPAGLVLLLIDSGRAGDALSLFQAGQSDSLLYLIASAHAVFAGGDLARAREIARQALKSASDRLPGNEIGMEVHSGNVNGEKPGEDPVSGGENGSPEPARMRSTKSLSLIRALIPLFLDLSLPTEASQAARLALSLQPNDAGLLAALAQSSRLAGEPYPAVEAAHLAAALDATNPAFRRELAASLEAAGDWQAALAERSSLLDGRFSPPEGEAWPAQDDLRALAACAIRAGEPEQAVEACLAALKSDPEDGLTQAIMGEALTALGQTEAAFEHFRLATQQAPHQPQPWLALAEAQKATGQVAKSIETLRAAAHAVPGDPAVHLALAEAHLAENAQTEALATLRRAHELVSLPGRVRSGKGMNSASPAPALALMERSIPSRIALLLGETLSKLGHLGEARQVLETAYQAHTSYPGLAYAFARTLLESGKPREALSPLAVAVNAGPEDPAIYLDYARALLAVDAQPEEAVRVLRQALELAPLPRLSGASFNQDGLPAWLAKSAPKGDGELAGDEVSTEGEEGEQQGENSGQFTALAFQDPQFATAFALLAEALAASGDLDSAQQAYFRALETHLAEDPAWRARLSLGLGRVALRLDQPETAIAALQEAARSDPQNPAIQQTLSDAFQASRLPQPALEAARSAVQLAPDDVEVLAWFADRALDMNASIEAIPVLNRAVQLDPQRGDLLIRLGRVHARFGEVNQALKAYRQVIDVPAPEPEILQKAASGLLELDDNAAAIACLERALELLPEPTPALLRDLASVQQRSGDLDKALETIDRAVQLATHDPAIHLFKADLLLERDRPEAARACLEHALNLHPHDPEIHQRIALVLRKQGDLASAYEHAEQMRAALAEAPGMVLALAADALTADLLRAMLQPERARPLLEGAKTASETGGETAERPPLEYNCLAAELALADEAEIAAAEALTAGFEIDPDHPRILALQARLFQRRGDPSAAQQSLQSALQTIQAALKPADKTEKTPETGENESPGKAAQPRTAVYRPAISIQDLLGVASAALDLNQWDVAMYLLRKATGDAPEEPFSHLEMARALVLRAEYQRLCQTLNVQTHAPGAGTLSEQAFLSFENALREALRCLPDESLSPASTGDRGESGNQPLQPPATLQRWQARGLAVFKPSQEHRQALKSFTSHPEDRAAYIAALSSAGDLVAIDQLYKSTREQAVPDRPEHPLVLANFALSLGLQGRRGEDLNEALAATRSAVERQPHQPLFHALLARLAHSVSELETARKALQSALSIWPDEPRWHSWAAEMAQAAGDATAAIQELSRATALEPRHLSHHLDLGNALIRSGDLPHGIRALEQAVRVAPQKLEPYMALTHAYLANGDVTKASSSAESAISVAPGQVAPLLLRAEIALRVGDPRSALKRAEGALQLQPDNPDTLLLMALALEKMGRISEAQAVLDKAIPLATEPLPLHLERVRLLESQGGAEAALPSLLELSAHYPDEPVVLARLARSHAASGQRDAAIRTAQQALRGGAALNTGETAGLHHLLGRLLWQAGQLDQATFQLNEATRQAPAEIEPYLDLGSVHQERRQGSLALQAYQQAIAIAPRDHRPFLQAGLVLKANRDYQGAESMLRRAADLAPNDIAIHRQLAALVALNLVHNRRPVTIES